MPSPAPLACRASAPHAVGSLILQPCSFTPPGLCYPKLPPLRPAGSLLENPLRLGIHIHDPHRATPSGLHRTACLCSTRPRPQGLPRLKYTHAWSPFYWAMPSRPTQACTISSLQACTLKACQARDPHMHDLCSAGPALQACQARDPQTCRISTPLACALQAHQANSPKTHYFTSAKGLHCRRTPPTCHSA
jgi:hypothetical protein